MADVVLARDGRDAAVGSRSVLVFQRIEAAMGTLATVDPRDIDDLDPYRTSSPGVRQVRLPQTLVAIDEAAHVGLADFRKRTIFTRDLALDAPDIDIERLVWSSVNTTRAIALSGQAWTSMQALPIGGISRHHMPPIRINGLRDEIDRSSVRIICHGSRPSNQTLARAACGKLERAGFAITIDAESWSDDSAIHLHIGPHHIDDDGLRIVDSWASGRLVVQMRGQIPGARPGCRDGLLVGHESNGLMSNTLGGIVVACEEVRDDPIFWAKLVKTGAATIAPLQRGWADIATAILA